MTHFPAELGLAAPAGPDGLHSVDLSQWRLDGTDEEVAAASAVLSEDERRTAARLPSGHRVSRSVLARAGLRHRLGRYCERAPGTLAFAHGLYGKPRLDDPTRAVPFFNLSHCDDWAALAVSWDGEVGVDIETVRPLAEDVGTFFAPGERRALAALEGGDALQAFYRCWTCKEAVVKALGLGLAMPLDGFEVSVAPRGPSRVISMAGSPAAGADWGLHHFSPCDGTVGALALRCGRSSFAVMTPSTGTGWAATEGPQACRSDLTRRATPP